MKNCQIIIRPLASCKRGGERKPAFLLAYPVTWRLFRHCRNCSPQLKVQEGITNIQTAVLAVGYKWLYNWSSLVSSLVHGALLHEQGWRFGSVSPTTTKSCQLQARGPPFMAWDTYEGWDGCINTRGRLRGDDASLWSRGPTGWAQIVRLPQLCFCL